MSLINDLFPGIGRFPPTLPVTRLQNVCTGSGFVFFIRLVLKKVQYVLQTGFCFPSSL